MKTQIDHDKLRQFVNPNICKAVCNQTGHTGGIHDVEIEKLSLSKQKKFNLSLWSMNQHVAAPEAEESEPQLSMAQIEADNNADIQRRIDKAQAIQRLEEYAKNAGLSDTQANADLIRKWVEASGGVWTVQIVDAAIEALNNQLEWRELAAPASALEPEKPEVLKPGQLPLDTPDWKLKQFSAEQLKDLVARRRKLGSKYHRPRGSFSSIF